MAVRSRKIIIEDKGKLNKINPETLKLWKKYKMDMELRELASGTISGYENDLNSWWVYVYDNQGNLPVTDLEADDITEFLYYCKTQGNNSRRMQRRMSSLGAFYKFLRRKKIISENPMEYIERLKKTNDVVVQTFLTEEQVVLMKEKLLAAIQEDATVPKKHMMLQIRAYALLALSTMARVSAICSIKWNQIDMPQRIIEDVIEKEGYLVTLYFSDEVREAIEELKAFRVKHDIEDGGRLFATAYESENGITPSTLSNWTTKVGEMIGVPTLHPHDFRHSGSNLLKHRGMLLEDISALLNHKSTDVTQKHYLKINTKAISQNKDKFGI